MQFTNDIDAVFDNAQPYITNVKSEYMYMGSDDTHDFFKHMDTRYHQLLLLHHLMKMTLEV